MDTKLFNAPRVESYRATKNTREVLLFGKEEHPPTVCSSLRGDLDMSLLERARSIVESFSAGDVMDAAINLESLRGIVLQLWETAMTSSQLHQEILAILESAIISVESLSEDQLSAVQGAISCLRYNTLTQRDVDAIRADFINKGFSPLALLSDIGDSDGSKQ